MEVFRNARSPRSLGLLRRQLCPTATARRTLTAAPRPNSGPLLDHRAGRQLPSLKQNRKWLRTLPIFVVAVGASMLAVFNYQKQSSSVVTSTLYSLRVSPKAREILGDEIYFASNIPWIRGELNQLHGRIDISYWVKGTKAQAQVRFKSRRLARMGLFETERWELILEDGTVIPLLDGQGDPSQGLQDG
ncbi:hypothetical protein KEM56_007098 [Ascosphaera pollenicola]|nr:hypothetical protein KEM56_007098 [Ascosphaera pollenicola]